TTSSTASTPGPRTARPGTTATAATGSSPPSSSRACTPSPSAPSSLPTTWRSTSSRHAYSRRPSRPPDSQAAGAGLVERSSSQRPAGRSVRTKSSMRATSPTATRCWGRRSSTAPSSRQPAAPILRRAGSSCSPREASACNSAQSAATPAAPASPSCKAPGSAFTEHEESTMKIVKTTRPLLVCWLAVAAATITAGQASAATLTVCPSGCAFSQIAPALAAANNGDTISIAPGTYKGGVTIDVSVTIAGAGTGRTIISGGGPVLTIGTFDAASEPTVSIGGVTITGGVTHSSFAEVFAGPGVIALGGGISVPPAAGFAPGATVTIANSVITGNKVAPTTAIDSGLPCPPDITITCINGDLPFAQAAGGGINTFGALTLTNTTVSNNQAGAPVASDVGPGGITSIEGGLTLNNSTVMGNQAIASAPNGRFAETGGVSVSGGTLTVDNTRISDNTASLSSSMPSDIPGGTGAFAGGINVGPVSGATITDTTISGNA